MCVEIFDSNHTPLGTISVLFADGEKMKKENEKQEDDGGERKVEFAISKSGERILLIDQWRFFKDTEDKMLVFWKCHELYKSNCPASVATTKNEANTRVVVINDTHVHTRRKRQ